MESDVLKPLLPAVLALWLLCASVTVYGETTASTPSFWDDRPDQELIEAIVTEMSDTELLGQVFMLGYVGIKNKKLTWILLISLNICLRE